MNPSPIYLSIHLLDRDKCQVLRWAQGSGSHQDSESCFHRAGSLMEQTDIIKESVTRVTVVVTTVLEQLLCTQC